MYEAEYWTDFIQACVDKTDEHHRLYNKTQARAIAKQCGIHTPELYQREDHISRIDFSALPERFVLKATDFCSKTGVYLLVRTGERRFHELLSGRDLTQEAILDEMTRIIGNRSTTILAEALVEGEVKGKAIPFDYKLYTFDSGVEFILQVDRNTTPNELALLDGRFQPIHEGAVGAEWRHARPGAPVVPGNRHFMVAAALTVHERLNRPFARIDLYTNGRDVYLGEITTTPGGPYFGVTYYFKPGFDRHLGALWAEGCRARGWRIPHIERRAPAWRKAKQAAASVGSRLKPDAGLLRDKDGGAQAPSAPGAG